jgi:hypothetical protein
MPAMRCSGAMSVSERYSQVGASLPSSRWSTPSVLRIATSGAEQRTECSSARPFLIAGTCMASANDTGRSRVTSSNPDPSNVIDARFRFVAHGESSSCCTIGPAMVARCWSLATSTARLNSTAASVARARIPTACTLPEPADRP